MNVKNSERFVKMQNIMKSREPDIKVSDNSAGSD